jgi:hypothetical protein
MIAVGLFLFRRQVRMIARDAAEAAEEGRQAAKRKRMPPDTAEASND